MTARRSKGDGSLHWSEARQRWIAEVTIGYTPSGKRIYRRGSGRTKTEAKSKLKEVLRDHEDGLAIAPQNFTVADAVNDWLAYGLNGRAKGTVDKNTNLAKTHILPDLGARKLKDLTAEDVDRWLAKKTNGLSSSTLGNLHSILNRVVVRAMARDKVKRNVVMLCTPPTGRAGRASKALTYEQAMRLLDAADGTPLNAYIVLSLLTGARTEELRALTWEHVDLKGRPGDDPPVPPSIDVWRSVRASGDTKTKKSRRSLAIPQRCADALRTHEGIQAEQKTQAGERWQDSGLVFTTSVGTALDAANVRRAFRRVVAAAELNRRDWTPRELRHSFVSILSDEGMTLEKIAELCGHAGTRVTEQVYRKQLRPVLLGGAVAMDRIFQPRTPGSSSEERQDA